MHVSELVGRPDHLPLWGLVSRPTGSDTEPVTILCLVLGFCWLQKPLTETIRYSSDCR